MAFEGINGKFNKSVAPGKLGIKPAEAKETKEEKGIETPQVHLKEETEANALAGLEIQGRTAVAKSFHAEDIAQCRELASLLPEGVDVSRYFTPLKVASVAKIVKGAEGTIDDAITAGRAEALFGSSEFAEFEKLFS